MWEAETRDVVGARRRHRLGREPELAHVTNTFVSIFWLMMIQRETICRSRPPLARAVSHRAVSHRGPSRVFSGRRGSIPPFTLPRPSPQTSRPKLTGRRRRRREAGGLPCPPMCPMAESPEDTACPALAASAAPVVQLVHQLVAYGARQLERHRVAVLAPPRIPSIFVDRRVFQS